MSTTALPPRRLGWFADRPIGVKFGAVVALLAFVVLGTNALAVSLLVDSIADVVDVDVRDFEAPPDTLDGAARELIRGAYKLSGQLLLALDVNRAVGT